MDVIYVCACKGGRGPGTEQLELGAYTPNVDMFQRQYNYIIRNSIIK